MARTEFVFLVIAACLVTLGVGCSFFKSLKQELREMQGEPQWDEQ